MSMSLISNDGSQSFTGGKLITTAPCLEMNLSDFCMSIDQDCREGRGSISYTDYYSNEDGIIREVKEDSPSKDNVEEDEDHTLTLRQSEEQHKQNVKSIFDQSPHTSSSSFKKIGRSVFH